MKHALILLVLFAAASARAQESPDEASLRAGEMARAALLFAPTSAMTVGSDWIDVTYYRIRLAVSSAPNHLRGRVLVRGTVAGDSADALTLDLADTMTVDSVAIQGAAVAFVRASASLVVTLDRRYYRGETVSVEVVYGGLPVSTGFGSFEFGVHNGVPWIWSLSEPYGAKDWWPCKDNPADKADSVDLEVTCDSSFLVGSNGRLLSVADNGDGTKTHHWHEGHPISTYLVSVAMTRFAAFSNWFVYSPTDSMEILNYVLPDHLPTALASLPKTVDMLRIFSSLFGLYPFIDEKYGHSEFGKGGAMEHQTMTSTTTFNENVISHELGHQWFGDLITCASWRHLWLNEGFAQYSTALYLEQQYGAANYWSYMNGQLTSAKAATGTLVVADTTMTPGGLFASARVYSKGASVLHMLRHVLGDSLFFRSLRNYAHSPALAYGAATTEDFQAVCEATSGSWLGYFFSEWAYGERYPTYNYSWTVVDRFADYLVNVTIDQTNGLASPSFFVMPMDIKVTYAVGDTVLRVLSDQQHQVFSWALPYAPVSVTLDPENWILKTAVIVTGVEETPATARTFRLRQNYPNPFNAETEFSLEIPSRGRMTLTIWNVAGEEIARVVDGEVGEGTQRVSWDAGSHPSGVYVARASFLPLSGPRGAVAAVQKLLLLK